MKMKKKLLSLFMVMVLCLTLFPTVVFAEETTDIWDGSVATEFAGGSGTESDPYQIATGAQLAYLSQSINSYTDGDTDYRTSYFVLTNDIDLSSSPWTPIGHSWNNYLSKQYFVGHFDGRNHTVSGMNIVPAYPIDDMFTGLFGVSEGDIKNLNVQGSIEINGVAVSNYAAGICGYLAGDIDNCTSNVDITFDNTANYCFIGGIVGYLDKGFEISNCINSGTISVPNTKDFSRIGGVAGYIDSNCTISKCKNEGNITAKIGALGGLAGEMGTSGEAGTVKIENSYNTGDVIMTGSFGNSYIGGVVGGFHALCYADPSSAIGVLENCFSTGTVSMNLVDGIGSCGPVYGDIHLSAKGTNTLINCYYVNQAIGNSANQDGIQITAEELNQTDFLKKISGNTENIWVQSNTGAVVLKNELADYSAVSTAIAGIPKDMTLYTDATTTAVTDAVESVVYNRLKAEQDIVDEYATAIEKAIAALKYKDADYSKVDEAIEKANSLNKDEYKNFSAVEAAINSVVRGKNITEQADVDAMAKAINDAIAALEKDADGKASDSESTQTGDNSNMVLWIVLMVVAGGGMIGAAVYGKKKKTTR